MFANVPKEGVASQLVSRRDRQRHNKAAAQMADHCEVL